MILWNALGLVYVPTWSNPLSGMDRIMIDVSYPKPVRKPAHSKATSYIKSVKEITMQLENILILGASYF